MCAKKSFEIVLFPILRAACLIKTKESWSVKIHTLNFQLLCQPKLVTRIEQQDSGLKTAY